MKKEPNLTRVSIVQTYEETRLQVQWILDLPLDRLWPMKQLRIICTTNNTLVNTTDLHNYDKQHHKKDHVDRKNFT